MSEHLGDGVYISHDGYQIWLAVNHHQNNVVALEPGVFNNFLRVGLRLMENHYGRAYAETAIKSLMREFKLGDPE